MEAPDTAAVRWQADLAVDIRDARVGGDHVETVRGDGELSVDRRAAQIVHNDDALAAAVALERQD